MQTRQYFFQLLLLLLSSAGVVLGQDYTPVLVADQTFKMDGVSEYVYAFAEGDRIELRAQELTGKKIKNIELIQWPDNPLLRMYDLDSTWNTSFQVQKTGIYLLRFQEMGLSKKICRFVLHRTPASAETARLDTRVLWNIREIPNFNVVRQPVEAGKRIEVLSLGGQVTVAASKFYLKKPVNVYQFSLPPNTMRWAFRVAVGQAAADARRVDADKLKLALQTGAIKLLPAAPETALGAFALGAAIDLTVSTAGEDVEYALVDWDNWMKFSEGGAYTAFIQQRGVSVDAQRRYAPLSGTYYFALRSDNWVDDINVNIDIEAVTEVPVFETALHLEPVRP